MPIKLNSNSGKNQKISKKQPTIHHWSMSTPIWNTKNTSKQNMHFEYWFNVWNCIRIKMSNNYLQKILLETFIFPSKGGDQNSIVWRLFIEGYTLHRICFEIKVVCNCYLISIFFKRIKIITRIQKYQESQRILSVQTSSKCLCESARSFMA